MGGRKLKRPPDFSGGLGSYVILVELLRGPSPRPATGGLLAEQARCVMGQPIAGPNSGHVSHGYAPDTAKEAVWRIADGEHGPLLNSLPTPMSIQFPMRGRSGRFRQLEGHQAFGGGALGGLADHLQVNEMGERLAGGHVAPGPLAEQHPHVLLHRGPTQGLAGLAQHVEALVMVVTDVVGPGADVGERVAVGR